MSECNHIHLVKLSGPIHQSGKDYVCDSCGEQFVVKRFEIGMQFGMDKTGPKSTIATTKETT